MKKNSTEQKPKRIFISKETKEREKRRAAEAKAAAKRLERAVKEAVCPEQEAKPAKELPELSIFEPEKIITPELEKLVKRLVDKKFDYLIEHPIKLKQPKIEAGERPRIKFSCEMLNQIFKGLWTMCYIFSADCGEKDEHGNKIETPFYCCSRCVYDMSERERPKRNEAIYRQYGIEVYGLAIIAPASAFA